MTETEAKALALVNELGVYHYPSLDSASMSDVRTAFCRAIEQHEAFKLEVSEFALGVKGYMASVKAMAWQSDCDEFIIAKPDPLVEAVDELWTQDRDKAKYMADQLHKCLAARGGRIVWEGE